MSFKTTREEASALLITKDKAEFYLTDDEYVGIVALMTTPGIDAKAAELEDGSVIALFDIRRILKLKPLDSANKSTLLALQNKEVNAQNRKKIEEIRNKYPFLKKT